MAVAAAAALGACTTTSTDGFFGGEKVDYRGAAAKTKPLDVPPDLSQLARESRYQPQGGVISAAAAGNPASGAARGTSAVPATVALDALGGMRVERQGQQRWLVAPQTPEQLFPLVKSFWEQRGFTLAEENAAAGVMETNWAENRAKLPADAVRNALGSLLGKLYDSGERDSYRTRIERTPTGREIYVAHRGIEETYADARRESTTWRARSNDPQLEAELLTRLMISLGSKEDAARTALAAPAATPAPSAAVPGVVAATQATTIVINEPFDRAWRRVGLALDRSGFTVEDRDRAAGFYYVRYVDPKSAGTEEPNWFMKLFSDGKNPLAAVRYRLALKTTDGKTSVAVQTSAGAPETGENAQRIITLLANELR
jgi:outer membrane protein assembly factor BamC